MPIHSEPIEEESEDESNQKYDFKIKLKNSKKVSGLEIITKPNQPVTKRKFPINPSKELHHKLKEFKVTSYIFKNPKIDYNALATLTEDQADELREQSYIEYVEQDVRLM